MNDTLLDRPPLWRAIYVTRIEGVIYSNVPRLVANDNVPYAYGEDAPGAHALAVNIVESRIRPSKAHFHPNTYGRMVSGLYAGEACEFACFAGPALVRRFIAPHDPDASFYLEQSAIDDLLAEQLHYFQENK